MKIYSITNSIESTPGKDNKVTKQITVIQKSATGTGAVKTIISQPLMNCDYIAEGANVYFPAHFKNEKNKKDPNSLIAFNGGTFNAISTS